MEKTLVWCLVFLLVFSSCSLSQEINYYVPTTIVDADGSSHTKISITLQHPSDEPFIISLFDVKPETIKTDATFPGFRCDVNEKVYGVVLTCDVSGSVEDKRSFSIEFDNRQIVSAEGNKKLLEQEFLIPYYTENMFIKVVLPEGMVIQKGQEYLPAYGSMSSDGRRIEVFWRDKNVPSGKQISIKIPYEPLPPSIPIEVVLILIILSALVMYFLNKRKSRPNIMHVLKSDEKLVLEGVLKHGDGVNQKILVRESGYSKAKVSKVLKSLQERGIVTLERIGRTNKVYINRNIGKKEQNTPGNN